MVCPVMNGTFVVCRRTDNVRAVSIVVECVGGYMGEMPEPIPLSTALGVQLVCIIVGNVFRQRLDTVLERFSGESGRCGMIQRKAGQRVSSYGE